MWPRARMASDCSTSDRGGRSCASASAAANKSMRLSSSMAAAAAPLHSSMRQLAARGTRRRGGCTTVAAATPSGSSAQGSQGNDEEDVGFMKEYALLKAQLLDNTRKCGGIIGVYLLLTVNATATLCAMGGCAASYVYFSWLCADVDNVKPTDTVPVWEANKVGGCWV